MVRDAFALAKAKAPTIIFIDELDAIGMKVYFNLTSVDDAFRDSTVIEQEIEKYNVLCLSC